MKPRKQSRPNPWKEQPDLLERAKALRATGASALLIARTLGHGLTKNSVIGKLYRSDIPAPTRVFLTAKVPRVKKPAMSKTRRAPTASKITAEPTGKEKITKDIRYGECRFPLPHTKGADMLMCAEKTLPGYSWCAEHHSMVFQPKQPRPARKAA